MDDPRLADTHVINPQWIMDGVYTLINDAEVKDKRRGEFSFADLARLLPADRYPSGKYPFLVELMEKFKLCYPVRGRKNTFLLPDLFSDIEPAGVWPKEQHPGLRFRFNYDSFPPDLFMAQFIVERYADIANESRWRSGVVVSDGRCRAIVRRAFSNEHIEIEVVGPEKQRRGYLHELLGVFRELHRPFENIEVAREIPYENVWLNYDHLLVLEEEKQPYFHPVLKKNIPVSAVLDGYDRPEKDKIGEQLDRIEARLEGIGEDAAYLKMLANQQLDILKKLNDDQSARDAFLTSLQKGLDEITQKLPANAPLLQEAKKFKTEPDVKTKVKLGLNLIVLAFETEVSWDVKALFRQIVQDMKAGHVFLKP